MDSNNSPKNYSVPDGTMKRLSWRPSETGSFMSSIGRHTGTSLDIESRLTSWHQQLSNRVQPWTESSSPSNRFSRNEDVSKFNLPVNPEYVFLTHENDFIADNLEINKDNDQTTVLESPVTHYFSRPKMNLAVLGDNRIKNNTERRDSSEQIKKESFAPRIQISAAISPRREDRDRFVNYNNTIAFPQKFENSEDSFKNKEVQELEYHNSTPISDREIEKKMPDQSNHVIEKLIQQRDIPISQPGEHRAIEKLIQSTVQPISLQGLEMRLVSPAERSSADANPKKTDDVAKSKNDDSAPSMPISSMPPAPAIDINAIANKVFQMLQRRQLIERERRGLY